MRKRIGRSDKGFTLVECIVVLAILAILVTVSVLGLSAYTRHSRFVKNNSYAETVFYAAQSSLNHYASSGQMQELKEYMLTGEGKENKVDSSMVEGLPEAYDGRLYYLTLIPGASDTEMLYRILDDYIYDKSILDAAITVEFDPAEGLVYSVCYSDMASAFYYGSAEGGGETGAVSISSRELSVRRERMVGYYCVDELSSQSPASLGKPSLKEVELVNGEELYLRWSLKESFAALAQHLNYAIKLYDKDTKNLLLSMQVNTDENNEILAAGASRGNRILCDLTVYQYDDGGTPQTVTLKEYPFYAYGENGSLYLVLDALDLQAAADLKGVTDAAGMPAAGKDTYSITRLGIGPGSIYARVQASGTNYKTSSWKQSNIAHSYFAGETWQGTGVSYSLKNARHLFNIRFSEAARESTDIRSVTYTQASDITWQGEQGMPAFGKVYDKTEKVELKARADAAAFPAIDRLGEYSAYTGKNGGTSYAITGLVLREENSNEPLGLFAVNEGSIDHADLRGVSVNGVDFVGALCGWNKGNVTDGTVSGTVFGQHYVGGVIGVEKATDQAAGLHGAGTYLYTDSGLVNKADVTGFSHVGGIIGSQEKSEAVDCRNYGVIQGLADEGGEESRYIGGIAGYSSQSRIADSISTPLAEPVYDSQGRLTDLYGSYVGGIVGFLDEGIVENCGTGDRDSENRLTAAWVTGRKYVGGIAGYVQSGAVEAGGYSNKANVAGESYVGGIVGINADLEADGTAEDTYSAARVVSGWTNEGLTIATVEYAGGITGYNAGRLENCTTVINIASKDGMSLLELVKKAGSEGDYIGGIAGLNCGVIYSKTPADVVAVAAGRNYVGGIAGCNRYKGKAPNERSIENYELTGGYLSGNCFVGGYVGLNTAADLFAKNKKEQPVFVSNPNLVEGNYFAGGAFGGNILQTNGGSIKADCSVSNFLGTVRADGAFAGGYFGYVQLFGNGGGSENTPDKLAEKLAAAVEGRLVPEAAAEVVRIAKEQSKASNTEFLISHEGADKGEVRLNGLEAGLYAGGVLGYGAPGTDLTISNIANASPVTAELAVKNADLSASAEFSYAGGITGIVNENITVTGCANTQKGVIRSLSTYMGGLAEVNEGIIEASEGGTMDGVSGLGGIAGLNTRNGVIKECSFTGQIYGQSYLGGIVSRNEGEINQCRIEPAAGISMAVRGSGSYLGGIAAVNAGEKAQIYGCVINGAVGGTGTDVGGAAGWNTDGASVIGLSGEYSVSGTDWVGGVIGYNEAALESVETGARVTVTALEGSAGGIAGCNGSGASILRSRNLGEVRSSNGNAAGIAALNEGEIKDCENGGDIMASGGGAGGIASVNRGSVLTCRMPEGGVKGQEYTGGIAAENHGIIRECAVYGMTVIEDIPREGIESYVGGITGGNFGSIDSASVGKDGKGISLTAAASRVNLGGVAGWNGNSAAIRSCGDVNANLNIESSVSGNLGGIAGVNQGTLKDCAFVGWVSGNQGAEYGIGGVAGINGGGDGQALIEQCSFQGSVQGGGTADNSESMSNTGGITGINRENGRITRCALAGSSWIEAAYSYLGGVAGMNRGEISGNDMQDTSGIEISAKNSSCVGGLVGYNDTAGRISDSSTGDWTVKNDKNAAHEFGTGGIIGNNAGRYDLEGLTNNADVTGSWYYVGGIIGVQMNTSSGGFRITGCTNNGDITTQKYSAGGIIGFWRDYGGTVSECYNNGNILAKESGAYHGRVAGIVADIWTSTQDMQVNIERCGNDGQIITNDYNGKCAGGIFGYVNAAKDSQLNISDCYNAGVLSNSGTCAGIAGQVGGSGNMAVTVFRCVNYGTGVNLNDVFNGIYGNGSNKPAALIHNFNVAKTNRAITEKGLATDSLNYYFQYFNDWDMRGTGRAVRLAKNGTWDSSNFNNRTLNGCDLVFPVTPGQIYTGTAGTLTQAKKMKDNYAGPLDSYYRQYYGTVKLGTPGGLALNKTGEMYTLSWKSGANADRVYYYEVTIQKKGDTQPCKVLTVPPTRQSVNFTLNDFAPGTEFDVTLQAVSGTQKNSSQIASLDTQQTAEQLPNPRVIYVIGYRNQNEVYGTLMLDNADELDACAGADWQVTAELSNGTSYTFNRNDLERQIGFGKEINLTCVSQAVDKNGVYQDSAKIMEMAYLRGPSNTMRAEVIAGSASLTGSSAEDLTYQFRLRNAENNSYSMLYRVELLYGGTLIAETSAPLQKELAISAVALNFSSLTNEQLAQLAGQKLTVRYYPWEAGNARYYQNVESGGNGVRLDGSQFESIVLAYPDAFAKNGTSVCEEMTFVLPPAADTPVIGDMSLTDETYTFVWDQKAAGSGIYDVVLTGYTEDGGSGQIIASERNVTGRSLTVDGSGWKYTRVKLTVTRHGEDGKLLSSSSEKEFSISSRLQSVTGVSAALKTKNDLIYTVRWNPSPDEAVAGSFAGYRVTASCRDQQTDVTTETGIWSAQIDLEDFPPGEQVTVLVTALSADQTKYRDSQPSVPYTFALETRMTPPDRTEGFSVSLDRVYDETYGSALTEAEFRDQGMKLTLVSSSAETGNYLGEAFIADTPDGVPESALLMLESFHTQGGLQSAEYNLIGLPADAAGQYLKVRFRAYSDVQVSSVWTDWYTFRLPRVKAAAPDLRQGDNKAVIRTEYIENGGPVEETKIQAEHKTLAWESVSYGDGYLIRTETDSGITDAQGQPVYQEYRLFVRETGLAQEPFEVYMPLGDLDEEYRTGLQSITDGLAEPVYVKLLCTESDTDAGIFRFYIPHSDILEGGDDTGFRYKLRVNPVLQCSVGDAGAAYVLELPDCTANETEYVLTQRLSVLAFSWLDSGNYEASVEKRWQRNADTGEYDISEYDNADTGANPGMPEGSSLAALNEEISRLAQEAQEKHVKELFGTAAYTAAVMPDSGPSLSESAGLPAETELSGTAQPDKTEETEETADAVKTESGGETGTGTDEDLTEAGTPAETKAAQPQTEKSRYQEPQTSNAAETKAAQSSAAEIGKIVPQQGGEGAEDE